MSATARQRAGKRRPPLFARLVGWLMVPFYLAAVSANFWLEHRLHLQDRQPVQDVTLLVGFGMFAVVGALLVAKRPTNPVSWIMAAIPLMVALFPAGDTYAAYVMVTRGRPDALTILGGWFQGWYWYLLLALTLIFLPLLFPDGRLLSRRWLPVAILPGIGTLTIAVLGMLQDTLTGQNVHYKIKNPIGIEGLAPVERLPVFDALGALLIVGLVGAFGSVVVRYRRSRGIERQQMKWFVYAVVPILILAAQIPLERYIPSIIGDVSFGLAIMALPTAIGIAVLRYHLYEIDLLINRTLVYGALTASLVLIYLCGVVSLQFVFRAFSGGESQVAVVASTLAIAALFNPLRRRIQSFIDRRFYRRKYDAARTLQDFSDRLRNETDLDELSDHLVGVINETMQPEHVSLWMRPPETREGVRA